MTTNASRYILLNDYADERGKIVTPGYASSSPACVVAIWPFKNPTTYVRSQSNPHGGPGASGSLLVADAVALNPVIVLDKDIISCTVQSSKQSYVGSCSINLIYSGTNYLYETNCGDWMMVWMLNNQEDRIVLLQAISEGQKLNDFYSGLKFVGRVSSIRQNIQQSPQGERMSGYMLQGNSFRELDSQIYFDPVLGENVPGWDDFYSRLSQKIQDNIFETIEGDISVPVALEFLLDVVVGKGIPVGQFSNTGDQELDTTENAVAGSVTSTASPFGYCVPQAIAVALNQNAPAVNGAVAYGALLDSVIGVQTFDVINNINTSYLGGRAFNPILADYGGFGQEQDTGPSNRFRCKTPLLGSTIAETPQFSCIPLYSHLMSYLNPAINEMYCALRPDTNGDIQPTLTVRQFPFTSPILGNSITQQAGPIDSGQNHQYTVTPYLSLPRWVIHPTLVVSHDLGKSDSLRYNFVLIYGDLNQTVNQAIQVDSRTANPPKVDMLDIGRNGIRIYPQQKVKAGLEDLDFNLPGVWMQLVADFAQSMQMTLSGTIQMFGIQAPIAVGDNIEYEGNVFHVESLTHNWNISSSGERDFTTQLQVSMGVLGNPNIINTDDTTFPDVNLFIPTFPDGNQQDQPGITVQDWTPIQIQSNPGQPVQNSNANAGTSNTSQPVPPNASDYGTTPGGI